ncbi:MAG: glycosyltransferase family 2 protein [Candidatus Pacebacteria bacterium]|nr:glycosyltransferase family 2 protein [Candidatus Paceibacterota bacterium]
MRQNPIISIIIPTYNRPELLRRAIKSVLNQTFQRFEIIVVDDGLVERANKIIKEIDDLRVVYIQHKENRGASAARNTGNEKARGEFVTFLDDDDEFYPEKLKKQLEIMKKFGKQIDYTFCLADIYSQQTGDFSYTQKYDLEEGTGSFFEEALSMNMAVATPSIFCKREKALEIGVFDVTFPNAEDRDFFIRLSKNSKGFFLNQSLVKVNFSDSEKVRLSGNLEFRIKGREKLLEKYNYDLTKRPKVLAKHLLLLAFLCQKNNDFKKANDLFFRGWKLNKRDFRFLKQILKNLFLHFFYKTLKKKTN